MFRIPERGITSAHQSNVGKERKGVHSHRLSARSGVNGWKAFPLHCETFFGHLWNFEALENRSHFSRLVVQIGRTSISRDSSHCAPCCCWCNLQIFSVRLRKMRKNIWFEYGWDYTFASPGVALPLNLGLLRTYMKLFLDKVTRDFPQAALLEDYGIVHYHMLCDGGIPLKTYMQKPFNHVEAATSLKKLHFNNCFSSWVLKLFYGS